MQSKGLPSSSAIVQHSRRRESPAVLSRRPTTELTAEVLLRDRGGLSSKRFLFGSLPSSFNINPIAHHSDFQLLQPFLPFRLERLHPLPVFFLVRHVHDDALQVIAKESLAFAPVPFDDLRFVTDAPEAIPYFQHRFRNPLGGHLAAVIELPRQQRLESPPFGAHKLPFPLPGKICFATPTRSLPLPARCVRHREALCRRSDRAKKPGPSLLLGDLGIGSES